MTDQQTQNEVTEFLAYIVKRFAQLKQEKKIDCFDVKFELNNQRYHLSLMEDKEYGYLKDN